MKQIVAIVCFACSLSAGAANIHIHGNGPAFGDGEDYYWQPRRMAGVTLIYLPATGAPKGARGGYAGQPIVGPQTRHTRRPFTHGRAFGGGGPSGRGSPSRQNPALSSPAPAPTPTVASVCTDGCQPAFDPPALHVPEPDLPGPNAPVTADQDPPAGDPTPDPVAFVPIDPPAPSPPPQTPATEPVSVGNAMPSWAELFARYL